MLLATGLEERCSDSPQIAVDGGTTRDLASGLVLDERAVERNLDRVVAKFPALGAKGVAEPPIVPVAAAIANAVSDAVGAPFDTLPITPFAVLAALRERGRARS